MTVTIIHETEMLVLGQERDEIRALGIMCSLGCFAEIYGGTRLFNFVEMMNNAVAVKQYGILYERANKDAQIMMPVAVVTWAYLGRGSEVIFTKAMRPLLKEELNSGKALWYMDMIAPFGHAEDLQVAFGLTVAEGHDEINMMRPEKNGTGYRRGKLPNLAEYRHKQTPETLPRVDWSEKALDVEYTLARDAARREERAREKVKREGTE
jgi:hemolysin-activating ACP:hemolysin acyltransferase